jgi:DMSO reductase anchor subunit
VTSKNTLRFNFVVFTLFFGTAAGLGLIFGVTQLQWYVANGQPEIGYALWMGGFLIAAGCVAAIILFARKLKRKLKEMVS